MYVRQSYLHPRLLKTYKIFITLTALFFMVGTPTRNGVFSIGWTSSVVDEIEIIFDSNCTRLDIEKLKVVLEMFFPMPMESADRETVESDV